MKKVAILIDGGFLSKVCKGKKKKPINADFVVRLAKALVKTTEELFRIYYYDAPPFDQSLTNPIDSTQKDYANTPVYKAIENFHRELSEKEFVALRKGKLSFGGWKLTDLALENIRQGKATGISGMDVIPDFKQKAVDMKIGLDSAWLATRKIVDKIILVTADNDFIPAMKFVRKEGLHVAIAKIENLNSEMRQHSDELIDVDITKI